MMMMHEKFSRTFKIKSIGACIIYGELVLNQLLFLQQRVEPTKDLFSVFLRHLSNFKLNTHTCIFFKTK